MWSAKDKTFSRSQEKSTNKRSRINLQMDKVTRQDFKNMFIEQPFFRTPFLMQHFQRGSKYGSSYQDIKVLIEFLLL